MSRAQRELELIHYYIRDGYYHHAQTICQDLLKKRANDPVMIFWRGFSVCMEGGRDGPNQAILQFESLQNNNDVSLASTAACLFAHKRCRLVDQEAVEMLTFNVDSKQSSAKSTDLLQAAQFYCHVGEFDTARELVDVILDREPQNTVAVALGGWVDLLCGREAKANKSIRAFEAAEKSPDQGAVLSSLLGKARYWQRKRARSAGEKQENFQQSLDCLVNAWAQFQWCLPALLEQVQVYMMMGKWSEALDIAHRVQGQDDKNIEAARFVVVHTLARESKYGEAQNQLQGLTQLMSRHEPKNAALFHRCGQSIARLAGRHQGVLTLTLRMAKMARDLAPQTSTYAAEVGEQLLMMGQLAEAGQQFREATRLDESNMEGHYGIIKCQILEGNLEDAAQQLEFLNEIQMSDAASNPQLTYLSALIEWAKHQDKKGSVRLLQQTVELHLEQLDGVELGYTYLALLNPDLMVELAKQFLVHAPDEPLSAGVEPDRTIGLGIDVLQQTLAVVPGLLEAQLLLARTKYLTNDLPGAQATINACLQLDPNYSAANVLLAQIHLGEEQYPEALGALEQALAHDFAIRETPLFSIVKSKVQQSTGEHAEAVKTLERALALPGVRQKAPRGGAAAAAGGGGGVVTQHERASVFVGLAQAQLKLNQLDAARDTIAEAKPLFMGSPQEMPVMIVDCDVAIARGDFRAAAARLAAIPKDSPHFVTAQTTLADVYLHQRNDKKKYIECYQALAANKPGARTSIALGEACMRVNEPQAAIRAYEAALEYNPSDGGLRSKVGKALVATHDYAQAKTYYEQALEEQPANTTLALELAQLAMRLGRRQRGQYEFAENVLLDAKAALGFDDSSAITNNVKVHLMLATLYKEQQKMPEACDALMQARSMHARLKSDSPPVKAMGVQICMTLADYFRESAKGNAGEQSPEELQQRALNFYAEALKHDNTHEGALQSLAQLHKERHELDQCQQQCVTLLRIDSANDQASMMLAELMFLKKDTESAIFHFQQLLEKRPCYYVALETLLRLLRHVGKLAEAPRYVDAAEKAAPRADRDPGLQFCKGLCHRYMNNPVEANRCFNLARRDSRWGAPARYHMIDIFIDPNKDAFLGDADAASTGGPPQEHIADAERLLRELPRRRPEEKAKADMLECYLRMAAGGKQATHAVLEVFQKMPGAQTDNVPAMLGQCRAHIRLKQQPKARNILKRICKLTWRPEVAEEFEQALLMLADLYIQSGKYDLVQGLCKRALQNNQSAAKAWEYLALVMEKEQSYADAADAYERAWHFSSEASASVGFKLGFNYLKAKRFVEAIDIAHQVLAKFPDYPKIKKEILDKARQGLRS